MCRDQLTFFVSETIAFYCSVGRMKCSILATIVYVLRKVIVESGFHLYLFWKKKENGNNIKIPKLKNYLSPLFKKNGAHEDCQSPQVNVLDIFKGWISEKRFVWSDLQT